LKDNIGPREIEAIVSKEYVFQLKLNEYNLKKGWENYIVSRIFEPQVAKEVNIHKVTIHYMFFVLKNQHNTIFTYIIMCIF
jgi:hypothetical protein